jgi:hypothetical protein
MIHEAARCKTQNEYRTKGIENITGQSVDNSSGREEEADVLRQSIIERIDQPKKQWQPF